MISTISLGHRRKSSLWLIAGLTAIWVVAWTTLAQAGTAPDSFSKLAKEVSPAVVWIASTQEVDTAAQAPELPFAFPEGSPFEKFFREFRNRRGDRGQPQVAHALGSGFIIDPAGYVVTNNHVIDKATSITVKLADGSKYDATLVGTDQLTDLALLKIEPDKTLPSVSFGNSDKAEVGDWVMAVGNPFGLGGTVTAGIISARGRDIQAGPYDDFLQIDAPINKGNSGGPLFSLNGRVIGVNTAIFSPNGGSVGIGFAIPSNIVKPVIAQIRENGRVERGWLGVQIQNVTPEIAGAMALQNPTGALVSEVIAGSPAEAAGLQSGDVIFSVNGDTIDNPHDLARQVAQMAAGSDAELALWRNGEKMQLHVTIGKMPPRQQLAEAGSSTAPGGVVHSKMLGVDLAALTAERRASLDIKDDINGVVIVDVQPGPALDQGLQPGDVIREVGHVQVTSPQQVDKLIGDMTDGGKKKAALLLINRHGRDLFVGLKPGVA